VTRAIMAADPPSFLARTVTTFLPGLAYLVASWDIGMFQSVVKPMDWPLRLALMTLSAEPQKWTLMPVANAGGFPGSPYFKITIAGTDRALTATDDQELAVLATFNGRPEQLWRIDQLTDGTYRVMPKTAPNSSAPLALSAIGSSTPTLARFTPDSDRQRWFFKAP